MSSSVTSAMRRSATRNIRQRATGSVVNGNGGFHQLSLCRLDAAAAAAAQHESVVPASSRCYGSEAVKDSDNSSSSSNYVSPFRDMFDSIQDGKTFLGTTEFQYPNVKYLKCGVPEHELKYKTTTYGRLLEEPFVRPNEHRVILQVAVRHIPLTELQKVVMKEIVGNRLNDETGILQLSSAQFGSRIENKRHVVSMLERAVESAKSVAARLEEAN
eukprot:jgi/Psemu1/304968/fgenesh1_kg.177_\